MAEKHPPTLLRSGQSARYLGIDQRMLLRNDDWLHYLGMPNDRRRFPKEYLLGLKPRIRRHMDEGRIAHGKITELAIKYAQTDRAITAIAESHAGLEVNLDTAVEEVNPDGAGNIAAIRKSRLNKVLNLANATMANWGRQPDVPLDTFMIANRLYIARTAINDVITWHTPEAPEPHIP